MKTIFGVPVAVTPETAKSWVALEASQKHFVLVTGDRDMQFEDQKCEGALGGAAAEQEATQPVSPLQARLMNDLGNLSEQANRSARALDILTRHPEFEEFIELLGLIRVPIRFTPIRSEKALVTE